MLLFEPQAAIDGLDEVVEGGQWLLTAVAPVELFCRDVGGGGWGFRWRCPWKWDVGFSQMLPLAWRRKCDLEHPPGCKIHRSGTLSTLEVSLFSSNVHFFSFINPAAVTVHIIKIGYPEQPLSDIGLLGYTEDYLP
ncbi:unnamed protein product, partial [Musa banksii]